MYYNSLDINVLHMPGYACLELFTNLFPDKFLEILNFSNKELFKTIISNSYYAPSKRIWPAFGFL